MTSRIALVLAVAFAGCAGSRPFDPLEPQVPRSPLVRTPEDDAPAVAPPVSNVDIDVEAVGSGSSVVSQPERPSLGSFDLCGECAIDPRWKENGKKLPAPE